jgi:hypothetical protein
MSTGASLLGLGLPLPELLNLPLSTTAGFLGEGSARLDRKIVVTRATNVTWTLGCITSMWH